MKASQARILLLLGSVLPFHTAQGAIRASGHQELSSQLNRAIDWTKHIVDETKPGKIPETKHMAEEIRDTSNAIAAIEAAMATLVVETPVRNRDIHIRELKQHQRAAKAETNTLRTSIAIPNPDLAHMNGSARRLLAELRNMQNRHEQEFSDPENKLEN